MRDPRAFAQELARPELRVVERTGFLTAKALDDMISGRVREPPRLVCGMNGINQFDVAKHLGVSVRTLQLRFREAAFAGSILNEIQRVQFENVCRKLRTTKWSIKDITFASGFGSLSRLKAIFVKEIGMSMRDYSNMSKGATFHLKAKK